MPRRTSELSLFKQINDAREHDQTAILWLQRGDEQRGREELQEALRIYPADSVAPATREAQPQGGVTRKRPPGISSRPSTPGLPSASPIRN